VINEKRLIALTQKVISMNSENPPGNELALAGFIEKDMRSLGLHVKTYAYAKNRPNIVAILKGTDPRPKAQKHAILITPHFDTVPIGNGWKYKPFGGWIHKGKLYGRGATDDKGNLASCMEVMRSLVEDNVKLKKDVVMAATVDEETGSHYGIIPLLKNKVLRPEFALVMDSDEFDTIVAQKGLIHGRIQIFGKKSHSAYNWRGVSAIELGAEVICRLKKLQYPYKRHNMLRAPTMNIGVIRGGEKVNMVCDFCEFTFDHRFLPGSDPQKILKKIRNMIEGVTKKYKILVDDIQQPYELDPHNRCVKLYVKTAKKYKCQAVCKGSEGATVITFFKKYGVPAFATGFGAHGTAHTNDEYIRVTSLCRGTRVLEQYIKEYDKQ